MQTLDQITTGEDRRLSSPAARRNRDPLLQVLRARLTPASCVLEIASGSGEHIVHFAHALPEHRFIPSDASPQAVTSITDWRNVLYQIMPDARLQAPLTLDVHQHPWPVGDTQFDAILCFNMIHIAPWQATLDLLAGAARHLEADGWLLLYGPFRRHGAHSAESNAAFEQRLKARDVRWGIRDLEGELLPAAAAAGLRLEEIIDMPANNLCIRLGKH